MTEGGAVTLKDLDSLNGTLLKVRGERRLEHDDVFRVGRQILRLSLGTVQPTSKPRTSGSPAATNGQPNPNGRPSESPPPDVRPTPASEPDVRAAPPPDVRPAQTARPALDAGSAEAGKEATALEVTFQPGGAVAALATPQTVLDAADAADVFIDWECRKGTCGCDPIRVVAGQEHLAPVGADEAKTLRDLGLEPGPYRLACVAKVQGRVTVETMN